MKGQVYARTVGVFFDYIVHVFIIFFFRSIYRSSSSIENRPVQLILTTYDAYDLYPLARA